MKSILLENNLKMHSASLNSALSEMKSEADVLLAVTTLVTEGRIPEKLGPKSKGFREGPHCFLGATSETHVCDASESLCLNYESTKEEVLKLWMHSTPLCIELLLTCGCQEGEYLIGQETVENYILLESWSFNITNKRLTAPATFHVPQLVNAIRSQLYFSQITAWLTTQDEKSKNRLTKKNLRYRIILPEETFKTTKFMTNSIEHKFPCTDIGGNRVLNASFLSMPRISYFPVVHCSRCKPMKETIFKPVSRDGQIDSVEEDKRCESILDDRMHMLCTLKGKHHCEDFEEVENSSKSEKLIKFKRFRQNLKEEQPSTSTLNHLNTTRRSQVNLPKGEVINTKLSNGSNQNSENGLDKYDTTGHFFSDLMYKDLDRSQLLLEAIERVGLKSPEKLQKRNNSGVNQYSMYKLVDGVINGSSVNNDTNKAVMGVQCGVDLGDTKTVCASDKQKSYSAQENKNVIGHTNVRNNYIDSEMQMDNSLLGRANNMSGCDKVYCDMNKSDTCSNKDRFSIYFDKKYCDSPVPPVRYVKMKDISNNYDHFAEKKRLVTRKLTFENAEDTNGEQMCGCAVSDKKVQNNLGGVIPTAVEQAKFRKNFDNAASMVFHSRTGLPLTSSPAPVRKGKTCFDFDSSINSVSAIKSALFSSSFSTDDDSESDGSLVSPCSPETYLAQRKTQEEQLKSPVRWQRRGKGHASCLLGSFEESVLNGRLEPVSTVHGFTAELGASGSFVPKHLIVPVTVFFYTLCDNDKVSSPYLCHINLGKKGYGVPRRGTVQVTLFNPLGTVVKMFVIMYDLTDMPPNSQTFIRQRTLYMPNDCKNDDIEWGPKWLKYLIHLRFVSSKSGKIYLHSDIRMIIFHKSDFDTATAHGMDLCYELRSFTLMPTNPRFSPRK